jgi:hypothetical protein
MAPAPRPPALKPPPAPRPPPPAPPPMPCPPPPRAWAQTEVDVNATAAKKAAEIIQKRRIVDPRVD